MSIFRKLLRLCRYWNTNTFISNLKFIIKNDIQAAIKDEVLEDCVFELDELRDILLAHVPRIYDARTKFVASENVAEKFCQVRRLRNFYHAGI